MNIGLIITADGDSCQCETLNEYWFNCFPKFMTKTGMQTEKSALIVGSIEMKAVSRSN